MNQTAEVAKQISQNADVVAQQGNSWGLIAYCIIVMAILYFLMVRPNKKRIAEYEKMLNSIKVGNRVLAAGIYGTVKKVNEKTIDLEIAKGVVIEVSKHAVASIE